MTKSKIPDEIKIVFPEIPVDADPIDVAALFERRATAAWEIAKEKVSYAENLKKLLCKDSDHILGAYNRACEAVIIAKRFTFYAASKRYSQDSKGESQ